VAHLDAGTPKGRPQHVVQRPTQERQGMVEAPLKSGMRASATTSPRSL
jgi:hypothetical protein